MPRFKITPVHDKPQENAILLGHEKIVTHIQNFIESKDMITPLSIAIHGDWGSGKTSVMKTLQRKLHNDSALIVFFEPWRYEKSDPPMALIKTILNAGYQQAPFQDQFKEQAKNVLSIAVNALSQKYLGTQVENITNFINTNVQSVESFSKELESLLKNNQKNSGKIIIMIDDLDRCDVENTLLILAIMKLFLDIENCICIAAVDFERLQQAWRAKYKLDDKDDKGKEYLEKIFQIKIAIPVPNHDQMKDFLDELVPDMDDTMMDLFAILGPKNPRSIKRMLNVIKFRSLMLNSDFNYDVAVFWTILEHIMSNEKLISMYDGILNNGSTLGQLIQNTDPKANHSNERNVMLQHIPNYRDMSGIEKKIDQFLNYSHIYTSKTNMRATNLDNNFGDLREMTNEKIE